MREDTVPNWSSLSGLNHVPTTALTLWYDGVSEQCDQIWRNFKILWQFLRVDLA